MNLLGRLLARKAAEMPLIVTLDDLHWADEASLAVLNQLVGGLERLPVLLVGPVPCRGRLAASLVEPARATAGCAWMRLPEDEAAALLSALLAPEGLPADLTQAILDRAGGNPFFLRELALAVRESASLPEADGSRSLAPLPSTVRRLILTRIDALPEAAQRVLPMAAVAGDQVDVEVLAAALAETGDDAALDEGLIQLEAREFLYRRWGEPSYRFTHALLREVAYDALAADVAAARRISAWDGRWSGFTRAARSRSLDLLAHHFDRSDDRLAALRYCLWAARRAAETWANTIALNWFGRTLVWLKSFAAQPPDEAEQERGATPDQLLRWRVEAIEGQAGVQAAIGHLDDAIAGYTLALELVTGSTVFAAPRRADLYRKLAIALHDRGDFAAAQAALEQGLSAVGEQVCLEAGRLHVWSGLLRFRRGELAEALVSCGRGIAILGAGRQPAGSRPGLQPPGPCLPQHGRERAGHRGARAEHRPVRGRRRQRRPGTGHQQPRLRLPGPEPVARGIALFRAQRGAGRADRRSVAAGRRGHQPGRDLPPAGRLGTGDRSLRTRPADR